jgi:hypothetical protein
MLAKNFLALSTWYALAEKAAAGNFLPNADSLKLPARTFARWRVRTAPP